MPQEMVTIAKTEEEGIRVEPLNNEQRVLLDAFFRTLSNEQYWDLIKEHCRQVLREARAFERVGR